LKKAEQKKADEKKAKLQGRGGTKRQLEAKREEETQGKRTQRQRS
jgi:hypothetical protein